jgi:hypothetical protein
MAANDLARVAGGRRVGMWNEDDRASMRGIIGLSQLISCPFPIKQMVRALP